MKKWLGILLVFPLMFTLAGCADDILMDNNTNAPEGYVQAEGCVIYLEFEGGFYGIQAADGTKYDPVDLPLEFKVDGLPVNFTAKLLGEQVSTHMWGILISIETITSGGAGV